MRKALSAALLAAVTGAAGADQQFGLFTNPDGDVDDFVFSPDGEDIAILADAETALAFEIFAKPIGLPGAPPKITGDLSPPAQAEPFRYVPDGSAIVYVAAQDDPSAKAIYIAPATGGPGVRLNGVLPPGGEVNPLADRTFAVSPDGARVYYLASERDADTVELFAVNVATPGQSLRISGDLVTDGDVQDFLLTPDGATVIYLADQNFDENPELFRVPALGGTAERVNDDLENGQPETTGVQNDFRLTPDGSRVVYRADQEIDVEDILNLYSAPVSGGDSVLLSRRPMNPTVVRTFRISPDSERVAFWADAGVNAPAELFTSPIAMTDSVQRINADLPPDAQVEPDYAFSMDGNFIVYRADQRTFDQEELYAAPADGSQAAARISRDLAVGAQVSAFRVLGQRVAYRSTSDDLASTELYSVPVTGGITRPMGTGSGSVGEMEVAADGRGLFYFETEVNGATRSERVVRQDVFAGPPEVIADFTSATTDPAAGLSLQPSPENENLVAYLASRPDPDDIRLWIAEADLFENGFE